MREFMKLCVLVAFMSFLLPVFALLLHRWVEWLRTVL